jgi:hypothetical protein
MPCVDTSIKHDEGKPNGFTIREKTYLDHKGLAFIKRQNR